MPARRILRRDDEVAVSNVLGAVLMFGLLVLTLVMIQVRFVPVWDREREANHSQLLTNQLGQLKSDLDRMADNATLVPISDPVSLKASSGFKFFTSARLPASLSFTPAASGSGFDISTSSAHLLEQNGQRIFAGSESWTSVVTGDTLTNVQSFSNLRIRIPTPASWSTGDSTTLTITNAANAYAGKVTVTNRDEGDNYILLIQTFAASSSTIPTSIYEETHDKNSPPPYVYINLLDDTHYQFDEVLAAAVCPCTVTLNRNIMAAEYTAAYSVVNTGGATSQVGSGGVLSAPFSRLLSSGNLVVATEYQRYVDQTFTLEHGAVILSQPDGDVMYIPPSLTARVVAGITDISWVVPALSGSAGTLQGSSQGTLTVTPGSTTSFVASMPSVLVTLPTTHGGAWTQFWTTTLQGAGLTYGTQFTATSTATAATLTVYGVQSAPGSTLEDLVVRLHGAQLTLVPRAGA